ncbi:titin-like isoform X2 [Anthonomus grandis grandis]|uniref:titin-like isoform X2 n=1 Tax=Anthonomus grandis grandis TaxID=2921223 RepID=UPI0021655D03|nr:titin-like isoform X2 [Anthonomus grandis grandis]
MAAETRKSRKSNFSQEEVDVLITTVLQNHDILYKETSKSFFHKEIRNQVWNIVLEEVNKVSQEKRTLNEIKNKWKKCQHNPGAFCNLPVGEREEFDDIDSMPLKQRLSHGDSGSSVTTSPAPQESVLQSQPISPTKLKVTRQGKPHQPPAKPQTPPPPLPPPRVCLKWNTHHLNIQSAFPNFLSKEQYVDATLVSEGKTLKCHRMILSSCSSYFEEVLSGIAPLQHPVLFMKDIPFWILKGLCDFMYAGEVHILQDCLKEFLDVATTLKIKGLALSPKEEEVKPVQEIKQEIESTPPTKQPEKLIKEEKCEEPPLPQPKLQKRAQAQAELINEPAKQEEKVMEKKVESTRSVGRPAKRKEERRRLPNQQIVKEKVLEDPPVAPKVTPKVAKMMLPKIPQSSRPAAAKPQMVRNVMKHIAKSVAKPSTSKVAHPPSRKTTDHSKKNEKQKSESVLNQKEKEKEKPILRKDNIDDPLDLLKPVYEEITKTDLPVAPKIIPSQKVNPGKLRERGNIPVRRTANKRVRKRRYVELDDEKDETFHSRKGTRSRPNVKIPKFYHTDFEEKESGDATIVREPHTHQDDPLIGVEVEEIKAEPVDVEENAIELEENMVNFMEQEQEMVSHEAEEIIGNYDSPLVNIKTEPKANPPSIFKKEVLEPPPIIMDVHSVTETEDESLISIKKEAIQLVDITQISTTVVNHIEETIVGTNIFETIIQPKENPSEIIITNVQSMAEDACDIECPDKDAGKSILGSILDDGPERCEPEKVVNVVEALKSQKDAARAREIDPLSPSTVEQETTDVPVMMPDENCLSEGDDKVVEPWAVSDMESKQDDEKEETEITTESLQVLKENSPDDLITEEEKNSNLDEQSPTTTIQEIRETFTEILPEADIAIEPSPLHPEVNTNLTVDSREPSSSPPQDSCKISKNLEVTEIIASSQPIKDSSIDPPLADLNEEPSSSNQKRPAEDDCADTSKAKLAKQDQTQSLEHHIQTGNEEEILNNEQSVPETISCTDCKSIKDFDGAEEEFGAELVGELEEPPDITTSELHLSMSTKEPSELVEADNLPALEPELEQDDLPLLPEGITNNTSSAESIEAELEQCLASTSFVLPPKPPEVSPCKLKVGVKVAALNDDEDFTKDIEFDDNFIGTNRPANYLGDEFGVDFDLCEEKDQREVAVSSGGVDGSEMSIQEEVGDSDGENIKTANESLAVEEMVSIGSPVGQEEGTAEPATVVEEDILDNAQEQSGVTTEEAVIVDRNQLETMEETSQVFLEDLSRDDHSSVVDRNKLETMEETSQILLEDLSRDDHSSVIDQNKLETMEETSQILLEDPATVVEENILDNAQEQSGVTTEEAMVVDQNQLETMEESSQILLEDLSRDDHSSVVDQNKLETIEETSQILLEDPATVVEENILDNAQEQSGVTTEEAMVVDQNQLETMEESSQILLEDLSRDDHGSDVDLAASIDEDQLMEDSLLADDMDGGQSEDGSEKTLEMIVNDLNESLGEMKK